ncbi:MAG: tetratricopeptide repeat protein [Polyangiaceae bacterium]|jgi:hypothetical protein|nr:tetratricopeptide repeat protein [Polyangiaceae bacterium]
MPSSKTCFGALCALVVALSASSALSAEPTAAEREEAKRAYTAAKKLSKEGKSEAALVLFRRAHELAPTPVTRLDLARALDASGKLVEAHQLAVTVAAMPTTKTETKKSQLAREEAAALAPLLEARLPKITFTIEPAGVEPEVAVDGAALSKELLTQELPLDPGEHKVSARSGGQRVERTLTLAEGERSAVVLAFVVSSAPVEPPPVEPKPLEPELPPTQPKLPPPSVEPPPATDDGLTPVVPVAFATAGVALLTGAITGGVALSQVSDLEAGCPGGFCPPAQHDLLSTHRALTTTSTVAFSIGGAAAVVGGVAWIIDAATSSTGAPRSSLELRWTGTGVALSGALP